MAKMLAALLLMLLATLSEADKPVWPTLLEAAFVSETLPVFEQGKFPTYPFQVKKSDDSSPPSPLFIVAPTLAGKYPVLLFHHGTALGNVLYSQLLQLISSHGYIVVAPQLCRISIANTCNILALPSFLDEINSAVEVANWLLSGLNSSLVANIETNVKADLKNIAISGHSRGGSTAFAVALGVSNVTLKVDISALVGLDPVAGKSVHSLLEPHILTGVPHSLNLFIPISIIGTGLGNQWGLFPPTGVCAPDGVNYREFFNECRSPTSLFVITDYGHLDMLNDFIPSNFVCTSRWDKNPIRKTVSGIFVAFLNAYFGFGNGDYETLLENHPGIAPTKLYPVEFYGGPKLLAQV